ncbi:MAG: competence/damage-inducible protein A [Bacteroidales bacterium]
MKVEIITIGDELLIGQVVNTNAAWIGSRLSAIGFEISQMITIGDTEEAITKALADATGRAEIVIVTGGLGPTRDDKTKQAFCRFFETRLVFNQSVYRNVEAFLQRKHVQMNPLNRSQAMIPESCRPLENPHGTAPGMWFEKNGVTVISLPGVPYEMKAIMEQSVLPELEKSFSGEKVVHKTVLTIGIPESELAMMIEPWENNLPEHISLAYLPRPGMVRLRITAKKHTDKEWLEQEVGAEIEKLKKLLPGNILDYDTDRPEELIGILLKEKKLTLSTAESCTGGYIAHLITSVAGSSDYFNGSVVAYSNSVKEKTLGVPARVIEEHGAVSREVVEAMASGVRKVIQSDTAIAVSGIAGPGGGTAEKPVGTVWIAVATPAGIRSQMFQFGSDRIRNIQRSANAALALLISTLRES